MIPDLVDFGAAGAPGMNDWGRLLAVLLAGCAVLGLLAAVAARPWRRAAPRRAVWRGALVAMLGLLLLECTGLGAALADLLRPAAAPVAGVAAAPEEMAFEMVDGEPAAAGPWWLFVVWAVGAVALLARLATAHILLARLRGRLKPVAPAELRARLDRLLAELGCRFRIRVGVSPALRGPMVFGAWRPVLVLPKGFADDFEPRHQEAILAHELGHLAGRDPAWQLLADVTAALLWWHPLAWWARERLREASESAADEFTLHLADGPGLLAEGLVALARRLTGRSPRGAFAAAAGPRSGLARRVRALLRLDGPPPTVRPSRRERLLGLAVVVLALVVVGAAAAAVHPAGAGPHWPRSLPGRAWTALAGGPAEEPASPLARAAGSPRGIILGRPDGSGGLLAQALDQDGRPVVFEEIPVAPGAARRPVRATPMAGPVPRDEDVLPRLGLSADQRGRIDELLARRRADTAELHRLPAGRTERGLEINRRWHQGLREVLTPEQYRRYLDAWRPAFGPARVGGG